MRIADRVQVLPYADERLKLYGHRTPPGRITELSGRYVTVRCDDGLIRLYERLELEVLNAYSGE